MARGPLDSVLQTIRTALLSKSFEPLTDEDLVHRFVERRDEAAFTALVRRHSGLVLKVCRHVLHHEADAEDAFQATILVFARKAGSIRARITLACWLHRVAYRCAKDLRKSTMRRRKHEESADGGRSPESPVSLAA